MSTKHFIYHLNTHPLDVFGWKFFVKILKNSGANDINYNVDANTTRVGGRALEVGSSKESRKKRVNSISDTKIAGERRKQYKGGEFLGNTVTRPLPPQPYPWFVYFKPKETGYRRHMLLEYISVHENILGFELELQRFRRKRELANTCHDYHTVCLILRPVHT